MTDLWEKLTLEGRFNLIERLNRIETGVVGFNTIVVPPEGFSNDDRTHNLVLDWLVEHGANVLNVGLEISRMESALHGHRQD